MGYFFKKKQLTILCKYVIIVTLRKVRKIMVQEGSVMGELVLKNLQEAEDCHRRDFVVTFGEDTKGHANRKYFEYLLGGCSEFLSMCADPDGASNGNSVLYILT